MKWLFGGASETAAIHAQITNLYRDVTRQRDGECRFVKGEVDVRRIHLHVADEPGAKPLPSVPAELLAL